MQQYDTSAGEALPFLGGMGDESQCGIKQQVRDTMTEHREVHLGQVVPVAGSFQHMFNQYLAQ